DSDAGDLAISEVVDVRSWASVDTGMPRLCSTSRATIARLGSPRSARALLSRADHRSEDDGDWGLRRHRWLRRVQALGCLSAQGEEGELDSPVLQPPAPP